MINLPWREASPKEQEEANRIVNRLGRELSPKKRDRFRRVVSDATSELEPWPEVLAILRAIEEMKPRDPALEVVRQMHGAQEAGLLTKRPPERIPEPLKLPDPPPVEAGTDGPPGPEDLSGGEFCLVLKLHGPQIEFLDKVTQGIREAMNYPAPREHAIGLLLAVADGIGHRATLKRAGPLTAAEFIHVLNLYTSPPPNMPTGLELSGEDDLEDLDQ